MDNGPATSDTPITLAQAQRMVDAWIRATPRGYFSELTNMAVLTEEVGEVARVMARRYGEQIPKAGDSATLEALSGEMADVLWVLCALANQTGVDLTEALRQGLRKRQSRDAHRFDNV